MQKTSDFTDAQLVQMFEQAVQDGDHEQWEFWYENPQCIDTYHALKLAADAWKWLGHVPQEIKSKGAWLWKNTQLFQDNDYLIDAFRAWDIYKVMSKTQYYGYISKILNQDDTVLYSDSAVDGIIRIHCVFQCNDVQKAKQLGKILHQTVLTETEWHCMLLKPTNVIEAFLQMDVGGLNQPIYVEDMHAYNNAVQRWRSAPNIFSQVEACYNTYKNLEKIPTIGDFILFYQSLQHAQIDLPELANIEMDEESFLFD